VNKFKKEHRYYVFKRKNMTSAIENRVSALAHPDWSPNCVVVEHDWPEYEIVWGMIQARVEGKSNIIAQLTQERDALQRRSTAKIKSCDLQMIADIGFPATAERVANQITTQREAADNIREYATHIMYHTEDSHVAHLVEQIRAWAEKLEGRSE